MECTALVSERLAVGPLGLGSVSCWRVRGCVGEVSREQPGGRWPRVVGPAARGPGAGPLGPRLRSPPGLNGNLRSALRTWVSQLGVSR
jgi:hypothetical protein